MRRRERIQWRARAFAASGVTLTVFLSLPAALGAGFANTWGGTGGTAPSDVALDASGHAYVVGGFSGTTDFDSGPATNNRASRGSRDAFLSKFGPDGSWLWTRTWGSSNDDRANSVVVQGTNLYVAGCFQDTVDFNPAGGDSRTAPRGTNGFPNNDAFLCRYDTDGNFKWATAWGGNGGDEAYGLAADGTGFVYVCGDFSTTLMDLSPLGLATSVTNQGKWDAFVLKFDASGTCRWARCWGGAYYDDCTCIAVDAAGNVCGGGMFASQTADFDPGPAVHDLHANNPGGDWGMVDVFLTKFDSNGDFLWARNWGGPSHWDAAQGVGLDLLSNVYVAGYFADTVDFNPMGTPTNVTAAGGDDAFLCKYDASGAFQWVTAWGGSTNDYARGIAIDGDGYVYVPGDFSSTNVDFDPGPGATVFSSHGGKDIALGKFDASGKFLLGRACGGSADDTAYGSLTVDASGNVLMAGTFVGPLDFGPLVGGTTNPAYRGGTDAYVARLTTARTLTVRKSGNGWSSLGVTSPVTRCVSLGVATQIVYTAADWNRILTLAGNSSNVNAAVGRRVYTQVLAAATADFTGDVAFAQATTNQTGYANVPTEWLAQWAEDAVVADPTFAVDTKYLVGLDPTTSNTFRLDVESFDPDGPAAVTVVRRVYTGGLSPDGMHGQLELQAAIGLDVPFASLAGTATTGPDAFDATGRRIYTNTLAGTNGFIRAVIR